MTSKCNKNVAAEGIPYFTPAQIPPAGTAFDPQPSGAHIPKLFQPLKIRGVEFQNRIWVSPMCQYSAQDGIPTPWHMAHLGGILTRGPGLTMIEATAVLPEGRITPEDCGIWSDNHIKPLADLVTFAHSQNQKIGIQLAHAGRKASTVAPWISGAPTASKEVGGWPDNVWGPSAIPYAADYPPVKALSKDGIKRVVQAFADGAMRAVKAGFDVVEIHSAHGYLLDEFLSPASNKRTDEYGGSFENCTRLLFEIVDVVRANIPKSMPLFVRVSATDWLEESLPNEPSWRSEDTVQLAPILHEHGVDLLDVSSGGNHSKQKINGGPAYQSVFARDVMQAIGARTAFHNNVTDSKDHPPGRIFVSTVGAIQNGPVAELLLQNGCADVIFVGRQFLRNPSTVWAWADELSVGNKIVEVELAAQIRWGFKGRGHRTSDGKEDLSKPHVDNKELHVGSCKV
ncbi:NADPH dehydrogenase [Coprinopsis marcescibilis]|uniref:NADPH dehydrogenase n=1 Tax=Coprinopsis marcescibilis TaxID=230819 RepID=A0A5C3KLN5_COPMA|nr:NADPH dehydrogenase [Coprinopsis marcescibilis]